MTAQMEFDKERVFCPDPKDHQHENGNLKIDIQQILISNFPGK